MRGVGSSNLPVPTIRRNQPEPSQTEKRESAEALSLFVVSVAAICSDDVLPDAIQALEPAVAPGEEPDVPPVSVAVVQAGLRAVVAVEAGLRIAAVVEGQAAVLDVAAVEQAAVPDAVLPQAVVQAALAGALDEPQAGSAEQGAGQRAVAAVAVEPGDFPHRGAAARARACFLLRGAAPQGVAEPAVLPDRDEQLPDGPQELRAAPR